MSLRLKPYPAMKNSGVPWLGNVPEHWDILPALAVYKLKSVKNSGMIEKTVLSLSYGRIIVKPQEKLRGLVPESFETYQIVDPGNIIVRTTDLQNDHTSLRIGYSANRGIITSAYMCLETRERVSSEFGYQFLNAYDLLKIIYGFGSGLRQNLDFSDIKRMPVLVPPLAEQSAIVRFLDNVEKRIRRFIAAKRRLIELLNEQKQAIIERVVTQGLDSDPSSYSGQNFVDLAVGFGHAREKRVTTAQGRIPWLISVPNHWGVVSSGRLFSACKELAHPGDVQLSATQAYGVIPQAEFEERVGRRVVKLFLHLEKRRHVEKDDFVISMRSFQGGLERAWATGCIRSSYVVIRPLVPIDTGYFSYLFKSRGYIQALQGTSNFIRDGQDLNYNNFCLVDLPSPPIEEQKAIADFLDRATEGINAAINRATKEVGLVREYRTRLIADVVTGKLDVRGVELPPLDDAEDLPALGDETIDEAAEEESELEPVEESADSTD